MEETKSDSVGPTDYSNAEYWNERWELGTTPWHTENVNRWIFHIKQWLNGLFQFCESDSTV